ncbi:MAG TPA: crotonyl-CoA carboxylase/reductase [Solirubrobacteraceae bacterium]|nr:crotonyl-CoA carboxylase/reductase [Solirubrobacteraceae bacterium]
MSTQSISAPQITGGELEGATREQLMALEAPNSYRAAYISTADEGIFGEEADRDVRRSIKVGEVPMPELAPDEVLLAVMASAINYNTVWSARFEPVPTFRFLERLGSQGGWGARHDLPHHVLGSDAAGIVVRAGSAVRRWKAGDRVVVFTGIIDEQDPMSQADGMLAADQRAWGYETNFGGLADYTIVKATQLIPKPAHLSWEEAACNTLCAMTAYRMLVGDHGARMKQGDITLIWGATGGVGSYAVQMARNGGGIAVGVVNSERKAELLQALGCDVVLRRDELGLDELKSGAEIGKRIGGEIRRQLGEDPHIVLDYIGRSTFEASVYVVRRGGAVVTCGSSTGYRHEFDNRVLWMRLKRIIGSHGANWAEAWETNRLIERGMIMPTLSRVLTLEQAGEAARLVQLNRHVGKVGVLCLAEAEGLGVDDPARREAVGERRLRLFRELAS